MAMMKEVAAGEQVMFETRLSALRVFFWPVFWGVILLLTLYLIPLALLILGATYMRWRSTVVQVTSRRVVLKTGIISTSSSEIRLEKVESVDVRRGLVDRVTGSGSVLVRGSGGTPMVLSRILRPDELRGQISESAEMQK